MQHSSEGHGRKICCLPCLCPLHVFSRGRHSVSPFFAAQTHGQGQTYSWILCTGVQTHSSSIQVKMRVHLTIEFWIQIFRPALCYFFLSPFVTTLIYVFEPHLQNTQSNHIRSDFFSDGFLSKESTHFSKCPPILYSGETSDYPLFMLNLFIHSPQILLICAHQFPGL